MNPKSKPGVFYEPVKFDPTITTENVRITHVENDINTADPGGGDTGTASDIVRFLAKQGYVKCTDGIWRRLPLRKAA